MERLKASRYNFFVEAGNDASLIFNGKSGALIEFRKEDEDLLRAILSDPNNSDCNDQSKAEAKERLREGGFLVSEAFDEVAFLKVKNRMNRYGSVMLNVILAPTFDCNFRCIYCSETLKKIYMSPEMVRAFKRFITNKITGEGFREFEMGWYGGEPLLCKDLICDLSSEFIDVCGRNGVDYNASLYTNAYAFDDDFIHELKNLKIRGISTTIDGPAKVHDKRRFLKGGKPTYDVIRNNIRKIIHAWKNEIKVVVRVNFDADNVSALEELLDDLDEFRGYIRMYYSAVSCTSGRGKNYAPFRIDVPTYREKGRQFFKMLEERGYMGGKPPKPDVGCMGENFNGFAIDPEGKIYKCIAGLTAMGESEKPIGTLTESGDIRYDETEIIKWFEWDPFDDAECRACKLLPLCMGGCVRIPILAKQDESGQRERKRCQYKGYIDVETLVKSFYRTIT